MLTYVWWLQNGHPTNPYCQGIEGVLQAYYQTLQRVQLYGPTNFSPVINHVARYSVITTHAHYFCCLFSVKFCYCSRCSTPYDAKCCSISVYFFTLYRVTLMPSVLWRCWLGGRKGIRPVKNWVVGVGMVICLEQGADLHIAQLMLLPLTVSCFSKTQIGFTFLVPAHPDGPGQRAVKRVCAYVETD